MGCTYGATTTCMTRKWHGILNRRRMISLLTQLDMRRLRWKRKASSPKVLFPQMCFPGSGHKAWSKPSRIIATGSAGSSLAVLFLWRCGRLRRLHAGIVESNRLLQLARVFRGVPSVQDGRPGITTATPQQAASRRPLSLRAPAGFRTLPLPWGQL